MDMKQWLAAVTKDASVNAIAREIEVPHKTLDTQLRSPTGLKPDMVVKIARAYDVSPVAALVDLGLITEKEARDSVGLDPMRRSSALRDATDDELLREIGRRIGERNATVSPLPTRPGPNMPVEEAARRRPGKPRLGD
jgi:hypothetical protein